MIDFRRSYEKLLDGEIVRLPPGKRARPTGKPRTCPTCSGNSYQCELCWETGKAVDYVIEDDPAVLQPWTGAEFAPGGGFAERRRADGQRVAYVENDQGGISVGIEPPGGRSYTVHLGADHDDDPEKRPRSFGHKPEALTWAIALRLADAELAALDCEE